MPKVLVLPEHIASQIAAGEVVERPASVVKELIENSLDAGATQIEIAIGSECRDIRIADNGCGMEADDAVLAFHRHATSKISSAEDLWALKTMGFRGEALPSVASVARVTCYTRTPGSENGIRLDAADGKVETSHTGCAPGTVMEITDLFYNVPARMKFLKKPSTEFAHIHEVVRDLSIAFPQVVFQLLKDGEVVLRTSGSGKLAQVMAEAGLISGKEELCQVTYVEPKHEMTIYGYIARPTNFRGDRKGILSIVNNRPVRCPVTYKALEYAYSDLIPRGKHPIAVLTLTANPNLVDVNVHPSKKEIKYSNGNDVYLAMQRALVEAVRLPEAESRHLSNARATQSFNSEPVYYSMATASNADIAVKEAYGDTPTGMGTSAPPTASVSSDQLRFAEHLSYTPPATRPVSSRHESTWSQQAGATVTFPSGWKLLGYLHNTYILFETPDGLEIVEQHIAHERTLYERVLAKQQTPGRLSENAQRLVISTPLNLSPEQISCLQENLEMMRKLGFDFEFEADNTVLCTQVPVELAFKDYALAVQSIIENLTITDKAELELEASKSVACQAAIKNGMPLSESDILQLVSDWWQTPRNDTCPHGRPIRLKFSMDKLFQMFHPG